MSELALLAAEQLLDPRELEGEPLPPLSHLAHPVSAYLNGLAPSSRRPQLAAVEAIARRSTQIYSAETMPWQRLRRSGHRLTGGGGPNQTDEERGDESSGQERKPPDGVRAALVRTGGWDVGASPPMALGVEASGVVRSVGSAVSRFQARDEVLTYALPLRQGTWAQLFSAPEEQVSHKPAGMSFESAGVFPIPALTAAQVLSGTLAVKPGEVLFVNGGGGVTGGMLVATGVQLGARVIATADPRSAERLRRYGADAVLDYHRSDWQAEVRRLAGGSVPVAVNAVRGAAPGLQSLVSDGGRLATITNEPVQSERGISVSGFFVSPDGALLEGQAASFAERGLTIPVGAVYGLAEAGTALNAAVAGRLGGGIVVDPRR